MTRENRYHYILDYFARTQPNVTTQLQFGSAFQLIVATLLSAQCTDKRINEITPALYAKYPDAHAMAQATEEDLLEYIHSVSYPNSKAKHLVAMAKMIDEKFEGILPDNTDELITLPGVGRKTANVVQAVWFGKATMAVDTHVYRVSHRLGLVPVTANTPYKVEQYLIQHIPEEMISRAHHWLLLHGRYICQSARPKCDQCPFSGFCPKLLEGSKL
ncbi:MAG TPA: endonuclease III [Prevotella sp.]|nr:endonuclease III [Prevotella sp.]